LLPLRGHYYESEATVPIMREPIRNRIAMRILFAFAVAALALSSCSKPAAPQGRWEGAYETPDTLIVARMEVEPDGEVRVSAPDLLDVGSLNADDRAAARQRLSDGLAAGWDTVAPRQFDFDGTVFRKPGGIAPQMKWDRDKKRMTLVMYLGANPGLDIPLHTVSDFSENPWAS
jgi:hypothetical protein